ncbi:MAG: hypothetical protein IT379_23575 [Deltaproteobacteria bacterium]|nr:hypothetical protein [Deltaproteobacteria bacterium]
MAWYDTILGDGLGQLYFRLAIEGLPYEFVTHTEMERAVSGTTAGRVRGLLAESLVGGERVHPGTAELEQDVVNVEIVDKFDGDTPTTATQVLAYRPSVVTLLTADATESATSLTVASTTGFVTGSYVYVGTETMRVTSVGSATVLNVTRGIFGSTAQRHYIGNGDTRANPHVTNRPVFLEGRRARLVSYGDGDSLTGGGAAQIWRGVLQADARLGDNGTTWQLQIAGIGALLEQDIGGDLTRPKGPRGIYYPASDPLRIEVTLAASTSQNSGHGLYSTQTVFLSGFFETQEAFCIALNVKLATLSLSAGGTGGTLRAIPGEEYGHWYLEYKAATTNARWAYIRTYSSIDLQIDSLGTILGGDANGLPDVTASNSYKIFPLGLGADLLDPGMGGVPRGSLGRPSGTATDTANAANAPDGRIYVDGSLTGLPVPASVRVEHFQPGSVGEVSGQLQYTVANTADRYIEGFYITGFGTRGVFTPFTWTPGRLPKLRFVATYSNGGTLDDFIDNLVANAPLFSNDGSVPFLLADDIEDWSSAVGVATRGIRVARNRIYAGSEATSLLELLTHEFRLIGVYPVIGSDGRLGVRALESFAATDRPSLYLNASNTLVDGQEPAWERGALGQFNTVRTLTGWSPRANEHEGSPIVTRDIGAQSLRKATRELEVAPRSAYADGNEDSPDLVAQYVELAWPVLGFFGSDYAVIDIECPLIAWETTLGSIVVLTHHNLPNWNAGTRGLQSSGLVIGRQWDLGAGRIVLRILVLGEPVGGYTPTLTIASKAAGTDATVGPFTFNYSLDDPEGAASYYQSGDTEGDRWAPTMGARVMISQWDVASPTTRIGTIVGFNAFSKTVMVLFDSAFPGLGASSWVLRFASGPSLGQTFQSFYAFIADATARLDLGGLGPQNANVFGG